MVDRPKALPPHNAAVVEPDEVEIAAATPSVEPVFDASEYESLGGVARPALRELVGSAPRTSTRLVAAWRLLLWDQALPRGAPGDALRRLTVLNLAVQQDLEVLEALLCLDPAAGVREQAALYVWRVARDRDRIVELLVRRLLCDPHPEVIIRLLSLRPPLPFDRAERAARQLMAHASEDVRTAAYLWWFDAGGPFDRALTTGIWSEPAAELQRACLQRWADSPVHRDILRDVGAHPSAAPAALAALAQAKRSFRLPELEPLLTLGPIDAVFALASAPLDLADRALLATILGLLPERRLVEREPQKLHRRGRSVMWHHLLRAYASEDAAITGAERSWVPRLEERIQSLEALAREQKAASEWADDEEDDDDYYSDWYSPEAEEAACMRDLVRLLSGERTDDRL